MNIKFHLPAKMRGAYPYPIWPKDWPPPAVGDNVLVAPEQPTLKVRAVDWLPSGEEFGDEPFVYVVLAEL